MLSADIFAALRWWVALFLVGAVSTPLIWYVLRWLPDRGYAFVKMLGLLLASYLFWLVGSLGFFGNNLGGILLALLSLAAVSGLVWRRHGVELRAWLRDNRRYILTTELVFAALFFFWAWVRAQNPAISGTEKPMEFAFLNAVGRSSSFPPLDPWMSGFAISYYYFGYVMTSFLARLSLVAEPVAFNLGIAWLTAGAAVGAYGLVYNLIAAGGDRRGRRAALALALVAAVALPLAGNLQILLEILHANGIGSPSFWAWLDVRDVNGPAVTTGFGPTGSRFWWWWRSSRVIHEYHLSGIAEEGLEPIAEFPGFSFLLGDMHPHVLALPFAFVSLAVALAWWLRPARAIDAEEWRAHGLVGRVGLLLGSIGLPLYLLAVVVLGGLSFLNTWDVLIHLFVIVGAFTLREWQRSGRWNRRMLVQALLVGAALAIPAILIYLPFYIGFRSQAGPPFLLPMLVRPTRLAHFLIIFGMPLSAILILVLTLLARQRNRRWRLMLATAGGLILALCLLLLLLGWIIASSPEGSARIIGLAGELGIPLPTLDADVSLLGRALWGMRAVLALLPTVVLVRLGTPWLVLLLALLAGAVVLLWNSLLQRPGHAPFLPAGEPASTALPFVLLLILTGSLLTLGPEFVYLRDNFGQRLNTIFKFYYQAWVLFGVAALYGLDYLRREVRPVGWIAGISYAALLLIALLFPAYGISSRAAEYGEPATLNGIDHYRYTQPDELDALLWLRRNVSGTPVIVEAIGGQYSPQGHGRVSATTGLPTILGWAGHEYQWRGDTPEPAARTTAVETIYQSSSWDETARELDAYGVEYIYVGPLEVSTYGAQARTKFEGRLQVAYGNDSVMIYRWLPPQRPLTDAATAAIDDYS